MGYSPEKVHTGTQLIVSIVGLGPLQYLAFHQMIHLELNLLLSLLLVIGH